jgi:hypothetical protein
MRATGPITPTLPSAVTEIQAETGRSTVIGFVGIRVAAVRQRRAGRSAGGWRFDTLPQIRSSITLGNILNYPTLLKAS